MDETSRARVGRARTDFERRIRLHQKLLIAPVFLFLAVFLLGPLGLMAWVSFLDRGPHGGIRWDTFTTEAYVSFLFERDFDGSLIWNSDYAQIFLRSFWLSISTTTLCLLISFPTALYMAMLPPRRRTLFVFLVTLPFWSNLLVRNYAWILILKNGGLLERLLGALGLVSGPLHLLYTDLAVSIGLTYSFLPFMVLPIYTSLEKLDFRLVEAAYDLGAGPWQALRRVVLPLTTPGLIAGSLLVFVPTLGAYVTPELLGGSKALMIGNLIQSQFGAARNWPFGAALAFALLALVLAAMIAYALRFRRNLPGA
ncbi:ABC transporter permease [Sorangium sp. So ce131]|uniref:ABC transporter permease n=1 Tax=Sorangium sp. So ce131 TaxID=3133282 RepID=UPI003F5EAA14